jgi:hypothetical protein
MAKRQLNTFVLKNVFGRERGKVMWIGRLRRAGMGRNVI